MLEANKALVRRYREDYFIQGQFDIVSELFGETIILHDQKLTPEMFTDTARMWRNAFPDLTCTIDLLLAEGDHVVEYTKATGTHKGEIFGVPATGKQIQISLVYIHRIEAGRIVEMSGLIDSLGLFDQLGAITLPE